MKIIQGIQIISLVLVMCYNADAAVMGAIGGIRPPDRPAPYPGPAQDIINRESSQIIELGARGLRQGARQIIDLTAEVRAKMQKPILTSLVFLASSEQGHGQLDIYVNGKIAQRQIVQLPMKRKAIQVDLDVVIRDVRSVVLQTTGNVLVQSVIVNSGIPGLPALGLSNSL